MFVHFMVLYMLSSVLDAVRWVIWPVKIVHEMTSKMCVVGH